jgi:hypothetical protein
MRETRGRKITASNAPRSCHDRAAEETGCHEHLDEGARVILQPYMDGRVLYQSGISPAAILCAATRVQRR